MVLWCSGSDLDTEHGFESSLPNKNVKLTICFQISVFKYLLLMVTNVNNTTSSGVKIDSHVALVDVLNVMSYRAWPSAPALARFTFLTHLPLPARKEKVLSEHFLETKTTTLITYLCL